MKMLLSFALVLLPAEVVGEPLHVSGALYSSANLTASFDQDVKESSWFYVDNETKTRIAKFQNGNVGENPDKRYKLFDKGKVLIIVNLTENDLGRYIRDFTLLNDLTIETEFNVTLRENVPPVFIPKEGEITCIDQNPGNQKKCSDDMKKDNSMLKKVLLTITVVVIVVVFMAVVMWLHIRWKRSSDSGEDDQKKEVQQNQNENAIKDNEDNLEISVQETKTHGVRPYTEVKYTKIWNNPVYPKDCCDAFSCDVSTQNEAEEEVAQQHDEQDEVKTALGSGRLEFNESYDKLY